VVGVRERKPSSNTRDLLRNDIGVKRGRGGRVDRWREEGCRSSLSLFFLSFLFSQIAERM